MTNFQFFFYRYLNCNTKASYYFDSIFSKIKEDCILIITTSEDPALYWQMPEVALKSYNGVISKTSYHREVAIRLVLAEMARTCAKYNKGLKVLCSLAYKPQQSFTIIVKTCKGSENSQNALENIKLLAHCIKCESHKFIQNSNFLDKQNVTFGCDCSEKDEGKVITGIGPLWCGEIFDANFVELMLQKSDELSCDLKVISLLKLIADEAR
mgnify:CR=1 FL=1